MFCHRRILRIPREESASCALNTKLAWILRSFKHEGARMAPCARGRQALSDGIQRDSGCSPPGTIKAGSEPHTTERMRRNATQLLCHLFSLFSVSTSSFRRYSRHAPAAVTPAATPYNHPEESDDPLPSAPAEPARDITCFSAGELIDNALEWYLRAMADNLPG
eukprot:3819001-Rhodomonas_salina.1